MTDEEAYKIWLEDYSKNYGSTGLMESVTISKQAWLAAVNYEREACAKIAEDAPKHKFGMDYGTSEWISQAIRARGGEK